MNSKLDHIVVDVEIQKEIRDLVGGWDATDQMGVAVAVVYEFSTDRYHVYLKDDVEDLRARILRADLVSGFNIWKFDFPVIWGLPGRERVAELLPKTNDILRRIWKSQGLDADGAFSKRHWGWKLDDVARGTLGSSKSGNGADAPVWYKQGRLGRVISYCIDDVRLERDLVLYVEEHGTVRHQSGTVLTISAPWGE